MKLENVLQNLEQTLADGMALAGYASEDDVLAQARAEHQHGHEYPPEWVEDFEGVARRVWRERGPGRRLTPAEATDILANLPPDQVRAVEDMLNTDEAYRLKPLTVKAFIALLPK